MRTLYLCVLALMCAVVTVPASFAQQSRKGYASEDSEKIKESLDAYRAIFGLNGSSSGAALNALCMPLAQPLKDECSQKVSEVTRHYKNAVTLLKDQPEKIDALPDVYENQYKRGRMADMAVTDQIGKARFQFTFISFLMWYVQNHPLPTIGNVPLQVPSGPVERPRIAPQS